LSAFARPGGIVFAHEEAHTAVDEAGAAEFMAGLKVAGLDGQFGKLTPGKLADALAAVPEGATHRGQPVAVSLTNITEIGTAYSAAEVSAIADVARGRGLAVHLDGARFAGAVAALGTSPAELTWRAGIDVMSFGGTKNGCVAADAVVFFDPAKAREFPFIRQRAGHGFSKHWFVAAQFDAYLRDGHWLELARHANAMGARLADVIRHAPDRARLAVDPAANEVFAVLSKEMDARLKAAGAVYYAWPGRSSLGDRGPGTNEVLVRLVTIFATTTAEVDAFAEALHAARSR
jgi:threonine aldolase